jgi:glycosyltransferase involved in cell wall biosynthesis
MGTIVSAIIPTHNRKERLKRAVNSVQHQTYNDIELIVVGSPKTPKSALDIVESTNIEESIYLNVAADTPAKARNIGIKRAEGEYVAFLDDDDEWDSDKIEKQVCHMQKTDAGVCHVGVRKTDTDGKKRAESNPSSKGTVTYDLLTGGGYDTLSAMMVQRKLAQRVEGFDEQFITREDGDFNLRLSLHTKFCIIQEPLVTKHVGYQDHISTNLDTILRDNQRFIKKHRSLIEEFGQGVKNTVQSELTRSAGQTAANQGKYDEARKLFIKSVLYNPDNIYNYLWLLLVLGGPLSFEPARITKRLLVRGVESLNKIK